MKKGQVSDFGGEAERRIADAAFRRARSLSLASLGLTELPDSLFGLRQLERLDIEDNQLTLVPEGLARLTRLQGLDISRNRLTELPESLCRLAALRELAVAHNQLRALPEDIGELGALQRLVLSGNRLERLPETLGRLDRLVELALDGNRLKRLPESLGQLRQMQKLDVAGNLLSELPDSIGELVNLRELVLLHNQLEKLPESLRQLRELRRIFLHDNEALGVPSEILGPPPGDGFLDRSRRSTAASVLEYYFRTLRASRPLNEAKLILVGRGGVGKTSLLKRLVHGTFHAEEPETPGVSIERWSVTLPEGERVRLRVWDFGGQRILHGTHQFFLTERTLYLLVLSGREDNATQDAEYWLQLIRSFGCNSPVVIALNKSSKHPFDVNRGLLLEKYPFIADFVKTDCQDGFGIPALREVLVKQTDALEHRKVKFPADWFVIKERLEVMGENFVEWERYQEICRGLGEHDLQAHRDLARYLHILGIALHFADDPRLHDTRVLKPTWVTEGIYALLRAGHRQRLDGVLTPADLRTVLDPKLYPSSKHDFLLRLMEKFQLCFRLPGQQERYLVPDLLHENQPDIKALLESPGLGFRYQYEVLPEGLLPRFIVQTHLHSESQAQLRWRTGVVLERDRCLAVVRADQREQRVDIHVTGPEARRRELLAVVRAAFDEQHRDLKGLRIEERVPLPGEPGLSVGYRDLLRREERGETAFYPEDSDRPLSIQAMLNGVEAAESRLQRRGAGLPPGGAASAGVARSAAVPGRSAIPGSSIQFHVFLSYNRADEAAVRHLKQRLQAEGVIVWHDEDELRPGIPWQEGLETGIKSSASIAVLVGEAGLGPWENEEMMSALDLAVRDRRPVIPVLLPGALAAPQLPMRLANRTWVDLRAGYTAEAVAKLVWGITGTKPGTQR